MTIPYSARVILPLAEKGRLQFTTGALQGTLNSHLKPRIAMRTSNLVLIAVSVFMLSINLACDFPTFPSWTIDLEGPVSGWWPQPSPSLGANIFVRDVESNAPITNATLIIREEGGTNDSCISDSKGTFLIQAYRNPDLDSTSTATWYVIHASASGYESFSGEKAFTVARGVINGANQAPFYPDVVFFMKHR